MTHLYPSSGGARPSQTNLASDIEPLAGQVPTIFGPLHGHNLLFLMAYQMPSESVSKESVSKERSVAHSGRHCALSWQN